MNLELEELEQYRGTEQYHKIPLFKANLTDGIMYVAENGYSWFITDVLAVIEHEHKVKGQEFLSITLKLDGDKGKMIITDGNNNILYKQEYTYTDAKQEVKMYFTNNVLMLVGEY